MARSQLNTRRLTKSAVSNESPEGLQQPRELKRGWLSGNGLAGAIVALTTTALLQTVAFRGWIPHDEGTLGQSALRILDGQWPHIDFLDVYPGLLGVLHAGVFSLLGPSISALRFAWLGVAALGAVSIFWLLQLRLERRLAAPAAVSLIVLGFVIYPASMPTWWNLSLGLTALAMAYAGWMKSKPVLVVGAGFLTGVSMLIKTTGGIFVAIALFLWFLAVSEHDGRWYSNLFTGAGLIMVVALIAPTPSLGRLLLLGIPAMTGILILRSIGAGPLGQDDRPAAESHPWLFAAGVVTLPALTVGIYLFKGRLDELVSGWILSPVLRFDSAQEDIPVVMSIPLLVVLVIAVAIIARRSDIDLYFLGYGLVGLVAVWGILSWENFDGFYFAAVSWSAPAIALGLVWWRERLGSDPLVLLVSIASLLFALVQIPLWNGFYASYAVPMVGLSSILLIPRSHRFILSAIGLTALIFLFQSLSGRLVGPNSVDDTVAYVDLTNPRAGISVPAYDGYYNELATRVREVADSRPIYAGPDAPEVAFLAGVDSATPAFFEVLDPDWDSQIVADLADRGSAVVVNTSPDFSDPIPEDVLSQIYESNERQMTIGKFVLTWSNSDD